MVGLFLTLWGRFILFFCTARSILQSTTICKGSNFSTFFSSHQHLLFSDFLIVTILKGVRWYPAVLLFKVKVKSERVINSSHVRLFATPWTVACQAPLSMEFFRQRILEWVAVLFCKGSSQLRNLLHCRQILYRLSHKGRNNISLQTINVIRLDKRGY